MSHFLCRTLLFSTKTLLFSLGDGCQVVGGKRFFFLFFFFTFFTFYSPPFNFMMELVCGGTGDIQLNPSLFKLKKNKIPLTDASLLLFQRIGETQFPTPQQSRALLALCLQLADKYVALLNLIGPNVKDEPVRYVTSRRTDFRNSVFENALFGNCASRSISDG